MQVRKFFEVLKKKAITILPGCFVLILFVNQNAKWWVMRQLLSTGLFNADMKKEGIKSKGFTLIKQKT